MKVFSGIDLNDSFVMSWKLSASELLMELEASIWPDSELYLAPKSNEYTCYRRITLVFSGFTEVRGLYNIASTEGTVDLDGTTDYGNIDTFSKVLSGFLLSGSFGDVEVVGGHVQLEVTT
ncbi:hypothetical protein SAMN04488540_1143 [Ferrimonas sediminum]|uniref:Immunity protein 50 n=1 Tax=Ferrimonas sediminum TaxID=718193 RepID=A0A1G8WUR5_9GAMM|nr:hypothetical protein [Ferrimonas sediminum]SDJ81797.1 hypothetical protein SAMN04488540_1143 [Ferrimonas sediminum]